MDEQYTTQKLLALRKLTRSIGEIVTSELREYVATLTPVFRPKSIFGDHIQSTAKEPVKGSDQAFKELQTLYEKVAPGRPFHLPRELKSPIVQLSTTLELVPVEYTHAIDVSGNTRKVTVTRPFKWVLVYAGWAPQRLTHLLTDLSRQNGELQQFVLHYLAMHVAIAARPGLSRMLETLHFPLESGRLPSCGELPITFIGSSISTRLPPDERILESVELSGKDAFEELADGEDIHRLSDPFKERLLALLAA